MMNNEESADGNGYCTYRKPRVQFAALIKEETETKTKATLSAEKKVMEMDLEESKITIAATTMAMAPDKMAVS